LNNNIEELLEKYFEEVNFQQYLKSYYELIQKVNGYIQDKEPWKLIKEDEIE